MPAHAMGYRMVPMRKGRRGSNENLIFSRTQVYLIAGSIIVIAILAFSLGHLISREETQSVGTTVRLESPALPEAEVLEEMKRLEQRLKEAGMGQPAPDPVVEEKEVEEKQVVVITETETGSEFSFTEKLSPQDSGLAIRVKTIEKIERSMPEPVQKAVNIKAYKPIIRAKRVIPRTPPEPARAKEPSAEKEILVTERVEESVIAPVAVEPEKEESVTAVPALKLKERVSLIPANPKYTVQVGSFPSESRAKALAAKLKRKGYNSYIKKLVRSRAIWYRVRVGAFEKRWQAQKSLRDLKSKEGIAEGMILEYELP